MSNPCTVTVNEVSIGITTVDVLRHFTSEEIARTAGPSDRMSRLANHLIEQHRYACVLIDGLYVAYHSC